MVSDVFATHTKDDANFTTVVIKDARIVAAFVVHFDTNWANHFHLRIG